MKYSVVSTEFADYQLADIWLRAPDRQLVVDASDQIEAMLRKHPQQVAGLPPDRRRIIVVPPPAVTFEVSNDRKVTIVSIRYHP